MERKTSSAQQGNGPASQAASPCGRQAASIVYNMQFYTADYIVWECTVVEEKRTRLEIMKEYVDIEYHKIDDPFEKRCAFIHSYGVSFCCTMIAAKRGVNIELAAMAGLLHDFYLYCNANDPNRTFSDHGRLGSIFTREALNKWRLTTLEETDVICAAILNHSDKTKVDTAFDEVLKDADLIQKCLYDIEFTPHETYKERYPRLIEEFGLSHLG